MCNNPDCIFIHVKDIEKLIDKYVISPFDDTLYTHIFTWGIFLGLSRNVETEKDHTSWSRDFPPAAAQSQPHRMKSWFGTTHYVSNSPPRSAARSCDGALPRYRSSRNSHHSWAVHEDEIHPSIIEWRSSRECCLWSEGQHSCMPALLRRRMEWFD